MRRAKESEANIYASMFRESESHPAGAYWAGKNKVCATGNFMKRRGAEVAARKARRTVGEWEKVSRNRVRIDGLLCNLTLIANIERATGPLTWARSASRFPGEDSDFAIGFRGKVRMAMIAPCYEYPSVRP